MTWLKTWLISITCGALITALANAMSPAGTPRRMARLAGGLLMLVAVLGPLRVLPELDLSAILARYEASHQDYSDVLAAQNQEQMKSIIAAESAAYIVDKAEELGITQCRVRVECAIGDGGFPVPVSVTVRGLGKGSAWDALSRAIETDFAIGREDQTLERTGT